MPESGLPAAAYAKLVDVDPPLADHVLEILRTAGLTAYAEPLAGDTGPYRDIRPPDRPTTRIFVERWKLGEARAAVERQLPELRAEFHADAARRVDAEDMAQASAADIDAAWQQIVAGFDETGPDEPAARTGSGLSSRLVRQHTRPPAGPRDYVAADDPDDERFVPPPPPPLPRPRDRFDAFAWAGTIGGPLAVVTAYATGTGGWLAGLGFAAFTAGFVTLIARSGDRRRDDDDNGAVV